MVAQHALKNAHISKKNKTGSEITIRSEFTHIKRRTGMNIYRLLSMEVEDIREMHYMQDQ